MNYEVQHVHEPELDLNSANPFAIDLGNKNLTAMSKVERAASGLIIANSLYLMDEATEYLSMGYDVNSFQVGNPVAERILTPVFDSVRRGVPDKKWLRKYKARKETDTRSGLEGWPIRLDYKGGGLLSKIENRTGIKSFEALASHALYFYLKVAERIAGGGFLVVQNRANGISFPFSDNYFEPVIDESLKLDTITHITDWKTTFFNGLAA